MKSIKGLVVLGLLLIALPVFAAEIPPTIPHPGINSQNGYSIGVEAIDIAANERRPFWQAPYLRDLPYVADSGWLDGDRVGYGCAFGHLEHNGEIIGRFTFRVVNGATSYMKVGDRYMVEGSRYYDGGIFGGVQVPTGDCPFSTSDYETANVPDERPVIPFWHGDQVVEIRDYRTVEVQSPGVTFELLDPVLEPFIVSNSVDGSRPHTVNNRVGVLAREFGVPTVEVYYDALGSGSMFAPDETPPSGPECNAIISMSQGAQVYAGSRAGASDLNPSELEVLTGDEWMLLFAGGKPLKFWTAPSLWEQLGERHRCGTDAEIDRVLFIFDPRGSATPFTNDLNTAVGIMEGRYPNAEIDVSLLVGGEGHQVCTISMFGQTQNVVASVTHRNSIGQMTMPQAGPDLDIPCSGYADKLGHLDDSPEGAVNAQAQVAAFYNG